MKERHETKGSGIDCGGRLVGGLRAVWISEGGWVGCVGCMCRSRLVVVELDGR